MGMGSLASTLSIDPATGVVGLLITAGLLGVTHGIEPDHMAGIAALTHNAESPWLSALVGGCFAAGHTILVVAWIALAYLVVGTTSFPPVLEQVGLLFVGIVLALLSLYLGISGTQKLVHQHHHEHGDGDQHAHYHFHLPSWLQPTAHPGEHGSHRHEHGLTGYLKLGVIGALFTLSPPVSMIAFISVTIAGDYSIVLAGIVLAYALAIITTMALIGAGVGGLFSFVKMRGERLHAVSQVVASALILMIAGSVLLEVLPGLLA